jgi:hypothetical protein
MPLAEEMRLGNRRTINQGTNAIAVTDTSITIAGQSTAVKIVFSLATGSDVWINFGSAAVVGTGLRIPGGGQPVEINFQDWGAGMRATCHAIATVAASMGYVSMITADNF